MTTRLQVLTERNLGEIESSIHEAEELAENAVRDIRRAVEAMKQCQRTPAMIGGESTVPMNAVRFGRVLEHLQRLYDHKVLLESLSKETL